MGKAGDLAVFFTQLAFWLMLCWLVRPRSTFSESTGPRRRVQPLYTLQQRMHRCPASSRTHPLHRSWAVWARLPTRLPTAGLMLSLTGGETQVELDSACNGARSLRLDTLRDMAQIPKQSGQVLAQ